MHSILFQLGPFTVRSYGLLLAVSFLVGIWLAGRRSRGTAVTPAQVTDLSLYLILSSLLGARLFYAALHWREFSDNPLNIVNPFQNPGEFGVAGLVFFGGFIFGVLTGLWYSIRRGISFFLLADVMSPSVALGLMLTRIGCFLNGCCFGSPSDLAWAVQFPPDSPAGGIFHVPVHPSQLYESLGALVILLVLLLIDRHKPFNGFTFWIFAGFYGLLRFSVDLTRYYDVESSVRVLGHTFSVSQFIGLGLVLGSLIFIVWPRKPSQQQRPMATPRAKAPSV